MLLTKRRCTPQWMLFLFIVSIVQQTQSLVNIQNDGEIWYCNSNPSDKNAISPLPAADLTRIDKLEQVHVMTRHGTRTSNYNFQNYFPSDTQYFHCNISTITSRVTSNGNYRSIPMLVTFEQDNQLLLNSNCESEQSWPILIHQHTQNAQILIDAYLGSDGHSSVSDLFDLSTTNQLSTTPQFIKFYASNTERTLLSAMALAGKFLNGSSIEMTETVTNDEDFNPYAPWDNVLCGHQEQYKTWYNLSTTDLFDNFIIPRRRIMEQQYTQTISDYISEGGQIAGDLVDSYSFHEHPGFRISHFYCNGLDIPLKNETFRSLIEYGKEWTSIFPDRESTDIDDVEYSAKDECVYNFMAIPMYKRVLDHVNALKDSADSSDSGTDSVTDSTPKMIIHSAHDSSIIAFLGGLGLHDGMVPYFAEMFTFEIYSAADNDGQYLFRFTHRGEFVPYKHCEDEYANGQSELCDLDVLLQNGWSNVDMTQREWAENTCATMTDDCVCGYCGDNVSNEAVVSSWVIMHGDLQMFSLMIGIIMGVVVTVGGVLLMRYWQCCLCGGESKRSGYAPADIDEDGTEIVMIGSNGRADGSSESWSQ